MKASRYDNPRHGPRDQTPGQSPTQAIAPDCRHYRGDRPCIHNRLCRGCEHYQPYTHRVCIIKLGALGDVIRTLCILPELRRRYPAAQITWVSQPNGCRMIADHPMIDRVMPFDAATVMVLQAEAFDLLINLDKEPQPCALAMSVHAHKKLGVGWSAYGTPVPLNRQAQHYFELGLSDDLKFCENDKSYPHLIYEALGWHYRGQRYELPLNESAADRMRLLLASKGWRPGGPTVGIFVGAGRVFANKMWPAERITQVVRHLRERAADVQIILLGGSDERATIDRIRYDLDPVGNPQGVIDSGTEHDEPSFVALVDACDVLFCGDTMAMHVAIARSKSVVAYFGPTCEQEIDLFGKGEKLVADVPCGPCYKRVCDQHDACAHQIDALTAVNAIARAFNAGEARPIEPQTSLPLPVLPLRKAG